nr:hypothetical protein [uncultured Undibacterium sp.]
MRTGSRFNYWVVEWADGFDPSLSDLMLQFPQTVVGNRVAIASCDSGPFLPSQAELKKGWTTRNGLAVSPCVQIASELPTPGFDEWYVYNSEVPSDQHKSFVNQFGFSPLDVESQDTKDFWAQVVLYQPLHVLGAGTPTMFVVTQDEALYRRMTSV